MELHEIEKATFTCRSCGWTGRGSEADSELLQECIDFRCPSCDRPLAVAAIPMVKKAERVREGSGDEGSRSAERESRPAAGEVEPIHHRRSHRDLPDGIVVDELADGSLIVPLLEWIEDERTGEQRLSVAKERWSYLPSRDGGPRPPFRTIPPGMPPQTEWREFLAGRRGVPLYDREDDYDEHCYPIFGRTWKWF